MLDRLGDEPTAIALQAIDCLQHINGKGDGHALSWWHTVSMTWNMIILTVCGEQHGQTQNPRARLVGASPPAALRVNDHQNEYRSENWIVRGPA